MFHTNHETGNVGRGTLIPNRKADVSEKVQFELGMEGYCPAAPAMQDGPPHEIKSMSRGGQGGAGEQAER